MWTFTDPKPAFAAFVQVSAGRSTTIQISYFANGGFKLRNAGLETIHAFPED
jgi:hypothetical protein